MSMSQANSLGVVRRYAGRSLAYLVIVAVCTVIIAPILVTLVSSFWSANFIQLPGHWSLANYLKVLTSPNSWSKLRDTLVFTAGSTTVSMVLGTTLAIIVTRTNVPFRRALQALPLIVMFLPGLLKDVAWIQLYSPNTGLVNKVFEVIGFDNPPFNIFSLIGMVLSNGICGAAVPYIVLLGPLGSMDLSLEEASRSSGARHSQTIRLVTLPVLRPALISSVALTSVMVASSFETPVLIGYPAGINTYMSELYNSVAGAGTPNYSLASAQAMVYLVLTSVLLIWYVRSTRMEARFALLGGRGQSANRIDFGKWRWALAGFVIVYFIIAAGQLVVVTILTSLVPFYTATEGNPFKSIGLRNYEEALSTPSTLSALGNSVQLALIVSIVTVILGIALSFVALKTRMRGRRVVEVIATMPIGLPPVVFSAALLITVLSIPGFVSLYGTIVPLVIACVVVNLPFAIRVLTGAVIAIQNQLLEASAASGAGTLRTVGRILVPLLLPAAGNAALLVFVNSLLQLGAVVFLITPSFNLLPTTIFSLWGTGNFGLVNALNVVSVMVPVALLAAAAVLRVLIRLTTRGVNGRARSAQAGEPEVLATPARTPVLAG
jgi:iron(III) transport system permease protein